MAATRRLIEPDRRIAGLDLGRDGEAFVADYLRTRGLVVLSRNWRCREGELDVVATDGRRLVVCEVKTRSTENFGKPIEHVTPEKIRRIRNATRAWLRRHHAGWCEVRFDVVSVLWPEVGVPTIHHLRGAF